MDDKKRSNGTILIWTFVGAAFIAVIIVLLVSYLREGHENAVSYTSEKINSILSVRSTAFSEEIENAENLGRLLKDDIEEYRTGFGSRDSAKLAKIVTEESKVAHVLYCENDKVISDENGDAHEDYDLSFCNADTSVCAVTETPFGHLNSVVIRIQMSEQKDYLLLYVPIDSLTESFKASDFDEYSFLAITDGNGNMLFPFLKYSDYESVFLTEDNVFDKIASGTTTKASYKAFASSIANGVPASVMTTSEGDGRMISGCRTGVEDWYMVCGVRLQYAEKLIASEFASTRAMFIKLVVLIIIFAIFVITAVVFNTLKSKEKGRVLEDKADTDLLTDLTNKVATERKIQEYLEATPNGRGLLFILDIDNFKKINDTMGHAFGDTLLKTLGKEIRAEFRMSDIVGRTGGDEFMVFLKDVNDDVIVEREAGRIAKFFHDFKAGGDYVKYSATASIGAAIYPDDAKTFKELYEAADSALYKAKKRGKNQLVFYNEGGSKKQ